MSESPKGWVLTSLSEIAKWSSGGTPSRKNTSYYGGDIPWVKTGDLGDHHLTSVKEYITEEAINNSSAKLFPANSVAMAMYGATIGRTSILPFEATTNQACAVAFPNGSTTTEFIYYLLLNEKENFIAKGKGGAQPNISQAIIKEHEIFLPPVNEQIRITHKLDSMLAKVDVAQARLDKIPNILKRFRQSVLAAATSGELTKEWRDNNTTEDVNILVDKVSSLKLGKLKVRKKKVADDLSKLARLPKNWAWVPNYKLTQDKSTAICAGPFGTIFKAKDFRDKGVPIIFLRHVKELGFNQRKPNYMDPNVWEEFHQDYSVFGGELLVAKLGDPPGEACIYPEGIGKAMVTPDVLKMNVDTNITSPEYLRSFFNSPNCKDIIRDLAFGATRLRIDIPMFKGFPIPLPPFNEQKEITRRVESLFAMADTVEKQYKEAKARTNRLTQSILAKAFCGELVPQDPKDEPASDLLKRISEAQKKLKKVTGKKTKTKKVASA